MESDSAAGNDPLRVLVYPSLCTPGWGSSLPLLSPHLAQAFFPLCLLPVFFSLEAWGRPPPGAEVTGKLPPFDPCGPWVAGDPLKALFPFQGCGLARGPLPSYCLRRGRSFPGFNRYWAGTWRPLSPPRGTGLWTAGAARDDPGAAGDFSGASLPRCQGAPGCRLGVSSLVERVYFLVFLGRPRKTPGPIFKVFFINKASSQGWVGKKHGIWNLMSWEEFRVCHLLDLWSFVAHLPQPRFPSPKNGGNRLWPACLPVLWGSAEVTCGRKHVSNTASSLSFCLHTLSLAPLLLCYSRPFFSATRVWVSQKALNVPHMC